VYRFSKVIAPIAFLTASVAVGCSAQQDKGATVHGKVTFDGAPLEMGLIVFEVKGQGEPRTTSVKEDGTYELTGVPVGPAKVAVRTSHLQNAAAANAKYAQKAKVKAAKSEIVMVPKRYENVTTSGLEYPVEDGKEINIDLKK
jgi:hypothetical protein